MSQFQVTPQADENQVNALIYTMGEQAEEILVSLHLTPEEASDYETVKRRLDAHFVARRNIIFERAKFNQRQQETEAEGRSERRGRERFLPGWTLLFSHPWLLPRP